MEAAEGLEMNDSGTEFAASGYPTLTRITSELLDHCEALLELFDSELPRADFVIPAFSTSYRYYVGLLGKGLVEPLNFQTSASGADEVCGNPPLQTEAQICEKHRIKSIF